MVCFLVGYNYRTVPSRASSKFPYRAQMGPNILDPLCDNGLSVVDISLSLTFFIPRSLVPILSSVSHLYLDPIGDLHCVCKHQPAKASTIVSRPPTY